jgi:hypothetical protein
MLVQTPCTWKCIVVDEELGLTVINSQILLDLGTSGLDS